MGTVISQLIVTLLKHLIDFAIIIGIRSSFQLGLGTPGGSIGIHLNTGRLLTDNRFTAFHAMHTGFIEGKSRIRTGRCHRLQVTTKHRVTDGLLT